MTNKKQVLDQAVNIAKQNLLVPAVAKEYPCDLNPFCSSFSKLEEDENLKLNEFLEKVILANNINELNKIVDMALNSGIRINSLSDEGFSFTDVTIFKILKNEFKKNEQESIIKKLAVSGANFEDQSDKKIVEICNKVQKAVEPQIFNKLKKLREIGENAAMSGTVENVNFDNQSFCMQFSPNTKVDVAKLVEGAKDLGFRTGDLKIGNNTIKIGTAEVKVKTDENGKRNYIDISDNSAFTVTFQTSLGELHISIYRDTKNSHLIQVKVENQELWNKVQKNQEFVGEGLFIWWNICSESNRKRGISQTW
ncbi:MAG: hypothetical protein KTV77_05145 [Wolbachia endosymbiont of Fragariocoptes setiger]|nr:hypothetical protein [Wolbachia endosymbiont of Fragariocoptes setiger]